MLEIDLSVMVHRLNVSPSFPPYPSKEASVRPRTRPGYSERSPQTTRCRIHQGDVLPQL